MKIKEKIRWGFFYVFLFATYIIFVHLLGLQQTALWGFVFIILLLQLVNHCQNIEHLMDLEKAEIVEDGTN